MIRSRITIAVILASATGCQVRDPLFCLSDADCAAVPGRPRCDLTGAHEPENIARTCVPDWDPAATVDAADVDAPVADAAVTDAPAVDAPSFDASIDARPPDGMPDAMPCTPLIAFQGASSGNYEIFTIEPSGQSLKNLTMHSGDDTEPSWSPDGQLIAFLSSRNGNAQVYVMTKDGTGLVDVSQAPNNVHQGPIRWSPDGTRILFVRNNAGDEDIIAVNPDGSNLKDITMGDPSHDIAPDWSPDGKRIVFAATRDGTYEIYTANPDGTAVTRLTFDQSAGKQAPLWSPAGDKILFFHQGDGKMYTMTTSGTNITPLYGSAVFGSNYAWSHTGDRVAFALADLHSINANGTGDKDLTTNGTYSTGSPSWSPDDSAIVALFNGNPQHIGVVPSTGGAPAIIGTGSSPQWRPNCR